MAAEKVKYSSKSDMIKPFTITVCSGKGGVGKSVLTANLASSIVKDKDKALVIDAVCHLPNQHVIFGVEPPVRLSNVLNGRVPLESAIFGINENIFLLVDSPFELHEATENEATIDSVIRDLQRTSFNYLVIDTPSGLSNDLIRCCSLSDIVLVVITDEPTSLLDAYGLIKILINFIDKKKIKLLVNNVIDSEDAEEISEKLNLATGKFLNMSLDVVGFVPYSRNVRFSIQQQELLVKTQKDDEASRAIMDIAGKIKTKYFKRLSINNFKNVQV